MADIKERTTENLRGAAGALLQNMKDAGQNTGPNGEPLPDVEELAESIDKFDAAVEKHCGKYAGLTWCAADVQTLRPKMTDEEAEEFLRKNENRIRDQLCEHGWSVLEVFLNYRETE